jgi:hypothetical protein
VIFLSCYNAEGSKIELIVWWSESLKKPSFLKCLKCCSCDYKSFKNAWATERLGCGWSLLKGEWLAKTGMYFFNTELMFCWQWGGS